MVHFMLRTIFLSLSETMKLVEEYPANYEIELNSELPGSGGEFSVFTFSDGDTKPRGLGNAFLAIIRPDVSKWGAGFAGAGFKPPEVIDAVFTTPNPDVVCVVSQGAGYWVHTRTREKTNVRAFPIRQVETTKDKMLFADFTRIACYGSQGLEWLSRIVADGLHVNTVDAEHSRISCEGWDPKLSRSETVWVDLKTGVAIG